MFGDFDNLVEVISEAKSLCAGLFVGVAWECPDVVAEARVARADDYGAVAFRFDAVVAGSNAEEGLTGAEFALDDYDRDFVGRGQ